jgi:hypothetical protein
MEDRSSRRLRTLVTPMAHRGLSANENASALIYMMAGSTTRSNQRPNTVMQDRINQVDETRHLAPEMVCETRHWMSVDSIMMTSSNGAGAVSRSCASNGEPPR